MIVSLSKRLRQMQNYSARAAVLFVYSPETENLCMVSIAVSLKPHVDMKETYRWLKSSNLPAATEGLVVAAQDQALRTCYYEHNILHQDVSPTCLLCSVGLETVDHIVTGYSALSPMNYIDRHNQVASIIHRDILRFQSIWYRHYPDRLVAMDDITVMWDTAIPTAGESGANLPDICFRNKKTSTCVFMDISCPTDGNIASINRLS